MSVADNFTDFYSGTSFVFRMAVDEYNAERNWTGLIDRYWLIVEELIAGKSRRQRSRMDCTQSCNYQPDLPVPDWSCSGVCALRC